MKVNTNAREAILTSAKMMAQAHGYGGMNFRELAQTVGIKAASIYYHFPSKADLGAAVARRYWEDGVKDLEAISAEYPDPLESLRRFPQVFRASLESENRLCLGSFLGAESDDLPDVVRKEIMTFSDVTVTWLAAHLDAAGLASPEGSEQRALAIFAAVAGAQLLARTRSGLPLFDTLIASYRAAGLLPA